MSNHFLTTPFGAACLVIIGLVAIFNIYAHWVDDGLFGRLLYMATAFTCFIGFFQWMDESIPYKIATTLIVIFALRGLRSIWMSARRYFKIRRFINAFKR